MTDPLPRRIAWFAPWTWAAFVILLTSVATALLFYIFAAQEGGSGPYEHPAKVTEN